MKMASHSYVKTGPNKLLMWLVIVSIIIHIPVLLYMNDLFTSKVMQYIDLALRDIKKPFSRGIPRPPMIPKEQEKPSKEKVFQMRAIQMPDLDQAVFDPGIGSLSSGLVEGGIGMSTKDDYKEMVRMRIEREKEKNWLKADDGTYKEGVVLISFIINLDGTISNLKVVKPSPFKSLNEAALRTVRESAPFPKPPPNVYKDRVEIPLTLTFEKI